MKAIAEHVQQHDIGCAVIESDLRKGLPAMREVTPIAVRQRALQSQLERFDVPVHHRDLHLDRVAVCKGPFDLRSPVDTPIPQVHERQSIGLELTPFRA